MLCKSTQINLNMQCFQDCLKNCIWFIEIIGGFLIGYGKWNSPQPDMSLTWVNSKILDLLDKFFLCLYFPITSVLQHPWRPRRPPSIPRAWWDASGYPLASHHARGIDGGRRGRHGCCNTLVIGKYKHRKNLSNKSNILLFTHVSDMSGWGEFHFP